MRLRWRRWCAFHTDALVRRALVGEMMMVVGGRRSGLRGRMLLKRLEGISRVGWRDLYRARCMRVGVGLLLRQRIREI
jgi:hypothetical protein